MSTAGQDRPMSTSVSKAKAKPKQPPIERPEQPPAAEAAPIPIEPAAVEPVPVAAPAASSSPDAPPPPPAFTLCPYCGNTQFDTTRCDRCKGLFEPLSRQATQNAMGPWQIRSEANPFTPGLSFDKLADLIAKGRVRRDTIIRGPTTRQFWSFACNTPGVAALLGECHSCHRPVRAGEFVCRFCEASLSPPTDRQHLGLAPVQLLPGQAPAATVASSGMGQLSERAAVAPTPTPAPPAPTPTTRLLAASVPSITSPTIASPASASTPAPANDQATRRMRQQIEFLKLMMIIMGVVCAGLIIILVAISSMKHNAGTAAQRPASSPATSEPSTSAPAP